MIKEGKAYKTDLEHDPEIQSELIMLASFLHGCHKTLN